MPDYPNASVAALAAQLIADQQERDELFTAWLNGTPTGGPGLDGEYPLPSGSAPVLVPCFAKLTAPLTGAAAAAEGSAEEAAGSAASALQNKNATQTTLTTIQTLLSEARTLRTQTETLRQFAASERAAAQAEREACTAIKAQMQAMLDAWDAAHP